MDSISYGLPNISIPVYSHVLWCLIHVAMRNCYMCMHMLLCECVCVMLVYMRPGLRKQVLSTQNTPVHIKVSISISVCAIQTLEISLTSLGFSTYLIKFMLRFYVHKMRYYISKSKI